MAATLTETNVIANDRRHRVDPGGREAVHRRLPQWRASREPGRRGRDLVRREDITTAFNDPATGASLAEQQIGQDVDVLFQVAGRPGQGVLEAACDAGGVYGIGVDVDQCARSPQRDCIVTSAEKKLVDAIDEAIQRVVDGEAVGGSVVLDAASEPPKVGVSAFHNHPDLLTPETQTRSTTRRPRWHPAS